MPATQTVFMFSGQGSHYFQMGRELFAKNAVFRQWLLRLDELAQKLSARRVLDAVYAGGKAETFDRTSLTHPAIFMIEYALAQCLLHAGVRPDMTLGASLGSFAAATVAGFIELEAALATVIKQADALETHCDAGGMIAILASPESYAEAFLSEHSELAGVNFGSHFAVAAPQACLADIEAVLRLRGITHQRLAVAFAFHSRWIDPAEAPFAAFARSISCGRGRLPLACCDQVAVLSELNESFFWRVIRRPIRFQDTLAALEHAGTYRYIDVGPSGTLATFVKYGLPASSQSTVHAILTPHGQDQKNLDALLSVAGSR